MKSPLGKSSTYLSSYAPDVLFAIERRGLREKLGLGAELPFAGVDRWTAWELSWLGDSGAPHVATLEISVPAESINIVESKSLKLYLNSFAMSRFSSQQELAAAIEKDLTRCTGADVTVRLHDAASDDAHAVAAMPGESIDNDRIECDTYDVDAAFLESDSNEPVSEMLHSHLLRSLCPVTDQPDIGSLLIAYDGPRIDRSGLLRYIVSYREHNDYHEHCVERIFVDIKHRCRPTSLSVYARYQRRGGIDINPYRSDRDDEPPHLRLWRQ